MTMRGFTLIEMMVAVTIFAIVMLIGVGALLALSEANARAQAINSVINNLSAAVEDMSRSIRVGTTYHCEVFPPPPAVPPYITPAQLATAQDCQSGGGLLLAFEPFGGDPNDPNDQEAYRLDGTRIERSTDGGATWIAVTAPEVSIDKFNISVTGAPRGDDKQPRALITIQGSAAVPGGTTTFNVQAGIVQRLLDI